MINRREGEGTCDGELRFSLVCGLGGEDRNHGVKLRQIIEC